MRPIRLTVRAFGPYAGEQVFDFRELGDRSLFLVHGPTGSGKTTVLDAICYALYGQASGRFRDGKHLRSDHARPSDTTEVTLDFSLGDKSYRVWRTPEQERPKKRGDGVTRSSAKATLWNRTGVTEETDEGEVLASQQRKVNDEIERKLGFRSDQFRQVIMLPQGEFRELLMSKSDRREEILEVLFGTDFYKSIQDALKERARAVVAETDDADRRKGFVLEQADAGSLEELDDRGVGLEKEEGAASEEFDKATKAESAARTLLENGNKDADKLAEVEEAESEFGSLKKLSGEFQKKRRAVELAGKAALLRKDDQTLTERDDEVAGAETELAEKIARHEDISVDKREADGVLAAEKKKAPERKEAVTVVQRLQDLAPKVEQLAGAEKELDDSTAELTRLKRKKKEFLSEGARLKESIDVAREELEQVNDGASKLDGCEAELKIAEREHRQRSELEEKHNELAEAKQNALDLGIRFDDAAKKLQLAKGELKSIGEKSKASQQELSSADTEAAKGDGYQSDVEEAIRQLERRERLADLLKELKAARKAAKDAATAVTTEEGEFKKLRNEYEVAQSALREGQAAVLAGQLTDGEPCPVCGSTGHPAPASAVEELPTEEDLKHLGAAIEGQQRSVKAAVSKQQECSELVSGFEAELKSVTKELGKLKDVPVSDLKSARKEAETKLKKGKAAQEQVTALKSKRDELADKDNALQDRIAELDEKLEKARKDQQASAKAVGKLETAVDRLQKDLGKLKTVSVEATEEKFQLAQDALEEAKKAKDAQGESARILKSLEKQEGDSDSELSELDKPLTSATKRQAKAAGISEQLKAEVPDDLATSKQLKSAITAAAETVRSLEKAYETASEEASEAAKAESAAKAAVTTGKKALATAKQLATRQRTKFKTAREAAGFKSRAAYEKARLEETELANLRTEIKTHDDDLAAAKKRLSKAKKDSKGIKTPDLKELTAAVEGAAFATSGARDRQTELARDIKQVTGWQKELRSTASKLEKLGKQYETIGLISSVANGKNSAGITFQRFVLGALLDDVLLEASERLRIMSKGRFMLERARERSDRRHSGGLDLVVLDSHTGTSRPVQSLSGGESFLASLSLALGLADVVQAYSGGIHLETIFIDEGFGTLDSEALDLAIRSLRDLQSGGRLVGIISHVPELREVVDAKLEIMAGRSGSTARFVT